MPATLSTNPYAPSAAQPGAMACLALADLNKASAKTGGTWDVVAFLPIKDNYEYTWQGQNRQGCTFIVTLVSRENRSQYCQGQLKKTSKNAVKFETVVKTVKHGQRFMMSNVRFVDDPKIQYVSCPLKIVVDLATTRMEPCIEAPDGAVQPVPPASIASSIDLTGNQFFDVTALIQEVEEIYVHTGNRSSFVVKIYDGSKDDATQKVKSMPLRFFFDTGATSLSSAGQQVSGENMKRQLEAHMQNKKAVSFFCISGAQDDDQKFSFRTSKNTVITEAVGEKAERLNNTAQLHDLQAADTVAFELQRSKPARDWANEPAMETRCGLLATFAKTHTGVPHLDDNETIWQCNWVRPGEPSEGQGTRNSFGGLWVPITFHDETGPIALYCTERAVIKLFNVVDAAEFDQLLTEGRLRAPFFASIKIQRKPSNPGAAQPGRTHTHSAGAHSSTQRENDFDCFVVDAAEQDMQLMPSVISTQLLPLLSQCSDGVLVAQLAMIVHSDHYAMAVRYLSQEMPPELAKSASKTEVGVPYQHPCSRAVVLIHSTKRSKVQDAGSSGHKLVTEDVVDLLASDTDQKKYTLISYCNLDNVTDFKLDPPRGEKFQAALASVTGVSEAIADGAEQPTQIFTVDDIQRLSPSEADALKPVLLKKLYFAALIGQVSRKRREPWTTEENPGRAFKCRALGRSPTGGDVPDYSGIPRSVAGGH